MKTLVSSTILTKFKDTIPEEEYQTAWKLLQTYQSEQDEIKKYKETEFQSEFLSKIFGDVLGYLPRTKSLKNANLIVEKKIENGQKFIDGAIIGNDGRSRIVIELKDTKSTDLLKSKGGKGGLHSLAPMQQASIYLFSEPLAELAVVSNFDTVIVFNKKEFFRQEYSLFSMEYDTFKEFYLLLNSGSFWSGVTQLMIDQSVSLEKEIDDEFYIKIVALHKMLSTQAGKYTDDLFNKFLALAILEDDGSLPTNLINTINERKNDFNTTVSTHWDVWKEFFKSMKGSTKKMDYLEISEEVTKLNIWKDISYFNKIKISKPTLDLLVEISKYDLFSIPSDKLFFEISRNIHNPYNLIDADDQFQLYTNIMTDYLNTNLATAGFQTLAFVNKQTVSLDFPLVKLYNEIAMEKIEENVDSTRVIMEDVCDRVDYFIMVEPDMLQNKEFINSIRDNVFAINFDESYGENPIVAINMSYKSGDEIYIRNIAPDENVTEQTISRATMGDKVYILNEKEQLWLDSYNEGSQVVGAVTLGSLLTVTDKENASLRINLETKTVIKYDTESEMWDSSIDDYLDLEEDSYIYFNPKSENAHLILKSDDFNTLLSLVSVNKDTILNLYISSNLLSDSFLEKAKQEEELVAKIQLFEFKLEKLQKDSDELAILKCEQQLDRLYEQQLES